MDSNVSDALVPLSVVAICGVALAAIGYFVPHDNIAAPKQATTATQQGSAGLARIAAEPRATPLIGKLTWRPPPAGDTTLTRIGFGSCLRQDRPQPIWDAVIGAKPQMFLMLGDNVYGDFVDPSGDRLVAAYKRQAAHPDFSKARAAFPMLAIWDDHDYGLNDGGVEFAEKTVAGRAFRDFWAGSGTLDGERGPGVSYARSFGPDGARVQIIFLDTRSFRTSLTRKPQGASGKGKYVPASDPNGSMLGPEQWQWFERQLEAPAELRIIVSSVQVLAEGHGWERWGNLPKERERLINLVESKNAQPLMFLSGDRHRAAFYRMERDGKPAIIESTSSALNAGFPDPSERGPHQLGTMVGANNFGMLVIDWEAGVATVSLRGEDGLAVSELAFGFGRD